MAVHHHRVLTIVLVLSMIVFWLPTPVNAARTCIWDGGGGDALASTTANWDGPDIAPVTGDNIQFDATSTNACTWDLTLSFGSFSINAGYSGTITQAANFGVSSFAQGAGTFVPNIAYTLTDSGDFIKTAGTISANKLNLVMTGSSKEINLNSNPYGVSLTLSDDTTVSTASDFNSVTIPATKTLTLNANFAASFYPGCTWSNAGIVSGSGTLTFYLYNGNVTRTFGTINVPVVVYLLSVATGSWTLTLGANVNLGNTFSASSQHASNTLTVDLSANNYGFSATSITIGTRTTFNARAGVITDQGSWTSSAGTFTCGTSQVHLTGSSKTITTSTSQFYNLLVDDLASYTMASNVYVSNQYFENGSMTRGAYTLYVNNDQAPMFTSSPDVLQTEGDNYAYEAMAHDQENESITYSLTTDAFWLSSINSTTGYFNGTPAIGDAGYYSVSVRASDGNNTGYQNFTLKIATRESQQLDGTTILSLVFCFGLLVVGFKYWGFWVLAGPVWIICALTIFIDYGEVFLLAGIGLGMALLIEGVMKYAD